MIIYDTVITVPFTYLIRFKPTGQVYYGVRYAPGTSPDDLWTTYFTSSKTVKKLIREYGKDAFDCQVRKTFSNAIDAVNWEIKVLKRMHVLKKPHIWLNRAISHCDRKLSNRKGAIISSNTRQKQSLARMGKVPWNKGITYTDEQKRNVLNVILALNASRKGMPKTKKITRSQQSNEKASDSMKTYFKQNGPMAYVSRLVDEFLIVKKVKLKDVDSWIENGWNKGRKPSFIVGNT